MGQKGRTESIAKVLGALYARKSWPQAELARHVGISIEATRKILREIQAEIVPLEDESDHPHVYWTAPKTWFPGGVLFDQREVPELVRQLRRLPRSNARERLLGIIADQLPRRIREQADAPIVTRSTTEPEEQYGPVVEDAAARKLPLRMRYLTGGRGPAVERCASVHLVETGPPMRFVAICHRSNGLRRFRVENMISARVDERETFRDCEPAKIDAYRAAGLDGFTGTGDVITCTFFVRDPDAGWVSQNVLEGMRVERLPGGIRVLADTNAIAIVARFVVGLGAAAEPETPTLARAVEELARGALASVAGVGVKTS